MPGCAGFREVMERHAVSSIAPMVDNLSPEQRRHCMANIRSKNTKAEVTVRKVAHALGYRFRLHRENLPGKPDLVFPRFSKVIFVHGCFWHSHDCRYGRVQPKTNTEYWIAKRSITVERDRRHRAALRALGWSSLAIWECQLLSASRIAKRLTEFLR